MLRRFPIESSATSQIHRHIQATGTIAHPQKTTAPSCLQAGQQQPDQRKEAIRGVVDAAGKCLAANQLSRAMVEPHSNDFSASKSSGCKAKENPWLDTR